MTARLAHATLWRFLHWPQGLRAVYVWFDTRVAIVFDRLLQTQDAGSGLVVHDRRKLAVLVRCADEIAGLVETVRRGAVHPPSPVRFDASMQTRLAVPLLEAVAAFRGRCAAQSARLDLNRELRQSAALKVPVLALMLCNRELLRRHALPAEVVELIVNRAYPTLPRRAPQWMRQRRSR